jgi:serine/threonine-protein kinase RsbW
VKILSSMRVPADLACLEEVVEAVSARGRQEGLSHEKLFHLALATEEIFVNICKYSYPEGVGEVEVACGPEGDRFVVEIADKGVPFDISSLPDPDVLAGIEERKIGGLGIFLIKKMTDEVRYRRDNKKNILTFILKKT